MSLTKAVVLSFEELQNIFIPQTAIFKSIEIHHGKEAQDDQILLYFEINPSDVWDLTKQRWIEFLRFGFKKIESKDFERKLITAISYTRFNAIYLVYERVYLNEPPTISN